MMYVTVGRTIHKFRVRHYTLHSRNLIIVTYYSNDTSQSEHDLAHLPSSYAPPPRGLMPSCTVVDFQREWEDVERFPNKRTKKKNPLSLTTDTPFSFLKKHLRSTS